MGAMGVNLISILVAAIAALAFGAAYYGDLGKQWMASSAVTEEQDKDGDASEPSVLVVRWPPVFISGLVSL